MSRKHAGHYGYSIRMGTGAILLELYCFVVLYNFFQLWPQKFNDSSDKTGMLPEYAIMITVCDNFCYLKAKNYRNKPRTIQELKPSIRNLRGRHLFINLLGRHLNYTRSKKEGVKLIYLILFPWEFQNQNISTYLCWYLLHLLLACSRPPLHNPRHRTAGRPQPVVTSPCRGQMTLPTQPLRGDKPPGARAAARRSACLSAAWPDRRSIGAATRDRRRAVCSWSAGYGTLTESAEDTLTAAARCYDRDTTVIKKGSYQLLTSFCHLEISAPIALYSLANRYRAIRSQDIWASVYFGAYEKIDEVDGQGLVEE